MGWLRPRPPHWCISPSCGKHTARKNVSSTDTSSSIFKVTGADGASSVVPPESENKAGYYVVSQ